ncbi:Mrp/NBP35 family ATP-binding protein [Streptomyces canus]|uniref:Mrp/NBP35 family ATP-binding protein n=1 Tax=Streptomyces canus TaxID=58343 RepID=UPI002252BEF4|nr:Mrp/NBP35 family ATP-binding protein [Streptomyces canus]MCX4854977.1 Mrp/NBP35 family ATP-binding protein [Streptomyces canus]WSW39625.1 Mrp/NBP35 family ATP-binding protein [Streptomyces canus]
MTTAQTHEHAAPATDTVRQALSAVHDPEIQRPITDLGMVKEITVSPDGTVLVGIYLTVSGCPLREKITADATAAVSALPGVREVRIELDVMSDEQRTELRRSLRGDTDEPVIPFARPGSLTRVYCVASGKGGVGKSSVTVNLAAAMASRGLSVGVLDADIYGHSVPRMLGVTAGPTRVEKMIMPPRANGVKVISVGMFTSGNAPVMWRGPLLHRALQQFLGEVYWGDLDVLLLDLPPGTGDIPISLAQLLPESEILVVTTPQAAAAEVAERAGAVSLQTGQRVAGVVENMSWLQLPDGSTTRLFGSGGGRTVADSLSLALGTEVRLLGQVPMDPLLGEAGDAGTPLVLSAPEAPAAVALRAIAEGLTVRRRGLAGCRLPVSPS